MKNLIILEKVSLSFFLLILFLCFNSKMSLITKLEKEKLQNNNETEKSKSKYNLNKLKSKVNKTSSSFSTTKQYDYVKNLVEKLETSEINSQKKVFNKGWLRLAEKEKFMKLTLLSDTERGNINPFRINKVNNNNNIGFNSIDTIFYCELEENKGFNVYNTENKNKSLLESLIFTEVDLLEDSFPFDYKNLCFSISVLNKDGFTKRKEFLCGGDNHERNIWYCGFKKYLNQFCDLNQPQKIFHQPVIIIPTPSHYCNEKWDYHENGKNWDCSCKSGNTQSPINLPDLKEDKVYLNTERSLFEFYNE